MTAAAPRKERRKNDFAARFSLALDCFAMPERMRERKKAFASCPAVVELMKGKRKEKGKEYFGQLVRIEKEVAKMFGLVK